MSAADWLKARALPVALLLLALAAIFGAVQTVRIGSLNAVIVGLEKKLKGVTEEYAVFRARVIDRTAEAMRVDRANTQRVLSEQAQITGERTDAYRSRIDALNARVAGLREQARGGGSGSRGAAPVPAASTAASGPDGAASGDGFSLELRATATAQAIRLDELQKWVKSQGQVDNSGRYFGPPDSTSEAPLEDP